MSRKPTVVPLGTNFGDWTVIGEAMLKEKGRIREYYIPVRCVCGTERLARKGNLTWRRKQGLWVRGAQANQCGQFCALREVAGAKGRRAQGANRREAQGEGVCNWLTKRPRRGLRQQRPLAITLVPATRR